MEREREREGVLRGAQVGSASPDPVWLPAGSHLTLSHPTGLPYRIGVTIHTVYPVRYGTRTVRYGKDGKDGKATGAPMGEERE